MRTRVFSGDSQRLSVSARGTKEAGRQEGERKRFESIKTPSASYSVTLRVEYPNRIGVVGEILTTIAEAGGDVGAVDIVQ